MREIRNLGIMLLLLSILVAGVPLNTASAAKVLVCGDNIPVISIISLDEEVERNAFSALLDEELPKACIEIKRHLSTNSDIIASRTWDYDVRTKPDGFIPDYDNGGFDILITGFTNQISPSIDLSSFYHSNRNIGNGGDNFYHFENETLDDLFDSYTSEFDTNVRNEIASDLQGIFHAELPSITVLYPKKLWGFSDDIILTKDEVVALSTANLFPELSNQATNHLKYAYPYNFDQISVQQSETIISKQYTRTVWQGLYSQDMVSRDYKALIADSLPTISEDKLKITVSLKDDVLWADGSNLNATDVVESFKRIMDPKFDDVLFDDFVKIFGNTTLSNGNISIDSVVKIMQEYIVEFNFAKPYFEFLSILSFPILPTVAYGTQEIPHLEVTDFNEQLLNLSRIEQFGWGSGPYKYGSINESSIVLVKNDLYWNDFDGFDMISFKVVDYPEANNGLREGIFDIVDPLYPMSISDYDFEESVWWDTVVDFSWEEIAINMRHPVLGTGIGTPLGIENPSKAHQAAKWVRQAISHAIPRQVIIEEIYMGLGMQGIVPGWMSGIDGHDGSLLPYEYNTTRSKELLAKAGYEIHLEEECCIDIGPTWQLLVLPVVIMIVFAYAVHMVLDKRPIKTKL